LIPFLSALVIRGGRNPLLEEEISNAAEGCGVVVPIPTFCPLEEKTIRNNTNEVMTFLIQLNWLMRFKGIKIYNISTEAGSSAEPNFLLV
jgi:hypothetical protein